MAVFTALRNKAGQVAAGLAGSAIKSTLGLNRAPGALGSSADAGPKPRNPANVDYWNRVEAAQNSPTGSNL